MQNKADKYDISLWNSPVYKKTKCDSAHNRNKEYSKYQQIYTILQNPGNTTTTITWSRYQQTEQPIIGPCKQENKDEQIPEKNNIPTLSSFWVLSNIFNSLYLQWPRASLFIC